jgi:hypothetical protein
MRRSVACRTVTIALALAALAGPANVHGQGAASAQQDDDAAIRRLLAEGYATAVFVTRDEPGVRRAFHPEFRMLVLDDGGVLVVTLDRWLERLGLDGTPSDERVEHRVTGVTVTGDAASARVEIWENGARIYSDHFLLYRFPEVGWRIVGKIFHDHD